LKAHLVFQKHKTLITWNPTGEPNPTETPISIPTPADLNFYRCAKTHFGYNAK